MQEREIPNQRKGFAQFMSEKDRFGEHFEFKLPGNHKKYGSTLGFCFTVALTILILTQLYLKAMLVVGFGDTLTYRSVEDSYFNSSHVVTSDQGLKFAFGITAYDSNQEVIEDLDYGEIKAKFYGWGNDAVMGADELGDLNTHTCTPEELGVEGNNSTFWPINPISIQDISFYKKKLKCSDDHIAI